MLLCCRSTSKIDLHRVGRMATAGTLTGILAHYWYLYLDKRIVGNTVKQVIKKTFCDQLIFAPITIVVFFGILAVLEGSSKEAMKSELLRKGPEVMLVDWLVYPPAQYINFRYLPTKYRLVYDCCIAFLLDIYFSHIKYER